MYCPNRNQVLLHPKTKFLPTPTPILRSPKRIFTKEAYNNTINPEFWNLSTKYLCPKEDLVCVYDLYFPEADEQQRILDALHEIASTTNIEGLQGAFLKLLIHHDFENVKDLLDAVTKLNHYQFVIGNILSEINHTFPHVSLPHA